MNDTLTQSLVAIVVLFGIAAIIVAVNKILDYLSNYFVTTKKYNDDRQNESDQKLKDQASVAEARSKCRELIFSEIKKKADQSDVNQKFENLSNKLDDFNSKQIQIIQGQAELKGTLDLLIKYFKPESVR